MEIIKAATCQINTIRIAFCLLNLFIAARITINIARTLPTSIVSNSFATRFIMHFSCKRILNKRRARSRHFYQINLLSYPVPTLTLLAVKAYMRAQSVSSKPVAHLCQLPSGFSLILIAFWMRSCTVAQTGYSLRAISGTNKMPWPCTSIINSFGLSKLFGTLSEAADMFNFKSL